MNFQKIRLETKKNYIRKFKFKDFYNNKYDGIYETDKFGSRKIGDLNARKKILVVGDRLRWTHILAIKKLGFLFYEMD